MVSCGTTPGTSFIFGYPEIEQYLVDRMGDERVLRVERDSRIWYAERFIDFPFQKNIHQLPKPEYEQCVRDLRERPEDKGGNFKEMLYARYEPRHRREVSDPLQREALRIESRSARRGRDGAGSSRTRASRRFCETRMHRPAATITPHSRIPRVGRFNTSMRSPEGVRADRITLGERVLAIDRKAKVATTSQRQIGYDTLISSAPLVALLDMCGVVYDAAVLSHNKVQVFNLGFDSKGPSNVHWIYYPQRDISFYRVGFYDNIFSSDRMSLYVEVGLPWDAELSEDERGALKARVCLTSPERRSASSVI